MTNAYRDPLDEWLKQAVGEKADPMVTLLSRLTDQQFDFCRAYVYSGSLEEAVQRSRLPVSVNPHLLIHLPMIAACINILTARRETELGTRSSAEITRRLLATELFAAEDVPPADVHLERETLLTQKAAALAGEDTNALLENVSASRTPDGIMQLPTVTVAPAQCFGPQWIIERLVTVAERCMQIEPVYDRKGRPIGEFKFEPNAALKAMEMLGRTMAMFRDRVTVEHEVSGFSDAEIQNRLRALTREHPSLRDIIEMPPEEPESDQVEEIASGSSR